LVGHLTKEQLEDYCQQRLPVAELLPVSDHLDSCEVCRRRAEYSLNRDAAFIDIHSEIFGQTEEISSPRPTATHLTEDQLAGYVDRSLTGDQEQMVADHLTGCELCVLAVDDLRTFRNQVAPSLDHEYHPALRPSIIVNRRRRIPGWLTSTFRMAPTPGFGLALVILFLVVAGWVVWRTTRDRSPKHEVVVTPAPLPQPAPSSQPTPLPPVPPAPLVAQLKDGRGELSLERDGRLSGADDLPPAYRNLVKQALTDQQISRSSQLKGLTRPPSALMGSGKEGNEFSVIEPAGNVLLTDRPSFRWSTMAGASSYTVEVFDSEFKLVVASPQLNGTSWSITQSLPRGKVYSWQVKAIKGEQEVTSPQPPAPQARFRVLDQAKANEITNAKRTHSSSHLILGLLYAEAGLLKESEQEMRLLVRANPDSEVARNLLRQVQALRRRSE
jgi:hypothetical protein